MVCLQDRALSDVLEACGWVAPGQKAQGAHIKALRVSLGAALDRMMGPQRWQQEALRRDAEAGFSKFAGQARDGGTEFFMAGMQEGAPVVDQKGD